MSFRFKNIRVGNPVTIASADQNISVPKWRLPPVITTAPRISDGYDTDEFSVRSSRADTFEWRIVGGAVISTGAVLTPAQIASAGASGQFIEVTVTTDGAPRTSPPIKIMSSTHMGMPVALSHRIMNLDVLALVPHGDITHWAIANGLWSNEAIWNNGRIPSWGARVLIPNGKAVTYDMNEPNLRMDSLRIDGVLTWATDQNTAMLVEHLVTAEGGQRIIGTAANPIGSAFTATVIISGKEYASGSYTPTDMNNTRDPSLIGRGSLTLGENTIWGAEKTPWGRANAPVPLGATSLTLTEAPVGIVAGDEIIIGGTDIDYSSGDLWTDIVQDEYRTIDSITNGGLTLNWLDPLDFPHDNQLPGSTRTDLTPVVAFRKVQNVIFRSEVTSPVWRRGHAMDMHHNATVDVWRAQFIGLGRTDKSRDSGSYSGVNGAFRVNDPVTQSFVESTPTAQDNIQTRYTLHAHKLGFGHTGPKPIYSECYVEDSPGWAMVHHDCDVSMFNNVMHLWVGGAMVSESGSEVGEWVKNLAIGSGTQYTARGFNLNPKILGNTYGDDFFIGSGFCMRGRAMRTNGNVAVSCPWGHDFFHRGGQGASTLNQTINPDRRYLDIKEAGLPTLAAGPNAAWPNEFRLKDYPIIHFADNEAIATVGGLFVTKASPKQAHDANVKIKRFKSWGAITRGASPEYVAVYILDEMDVVASKYAFSSAVGVGAGGNTYQISWVNNRVEGFPIALNNGGSTDKHSPAEIKGGSHDFHDAIETPRYAHVGLDAVNCPILYAGSAPVGATKTNLEVTFQESDFDGEFIDYDLDPTENSPLKVTTWNGNEVTAHIDRNLYRKSDNLSTLGKFTEKVFGDIIFTNSHGDMVAWIDRFGYYQHESDNVLVMPYLISDRLTGRPAKFIKMVVCTGGTAGKENKGTYPYAATPITLTTPNLLATVAKNGTVVLDIAALTEPSGASGTYVLDYNDNDPFEGDVIKPDKGVAVLSSAAGTVTYTPDRNYTGEDEMFVFLKSGGRYATVRIEILVGGSGAGLTVPVVDTHFSIATGDASGQIKVNTLAKPGTDGARILTTYYRTAGATDRRRLCHGYPLTTTTISVDSDGVALTPGASVSVQLEYVVGYGRANSGLSAADTANAGA